jgi:hypothetical protein
MRPSSLLVTGTFVVLAAAACGHRLDPVPGVAMAPLPVPILSYEALAEQGNKRVTVRVRRGGGALLYIGVHHTQDPADPQIAEIRAAWDEFQATVALAEGRLGRYWGGFDGAVKTFGEAGAVFVLGSDHDVPVHTLEASLETEVAFVLARWRPDRVAMFYVLRGAMGKGGPEAREREAAELVRKRTAWPGLEGSLRNVAQLDSLYRVELPQLNDWRTADGTILWPGRATSYLNEIATTVNQFRDEYMVNLLRTLLDRGERVFAVVGNSHVVMQAPALEALDDR